MRSFLSRCGGRRCLRRRRVMVVVKVVGQGPDARANYRGDARGLGRVGSLEGAMSDVHIYHGDG